MVVTRCIAMIYQRLKSVKPELCPCGCADAMESEERAVCWKPGHQAGFAGTVAWRKSNV